MREGLIASDDPRAADVRELLATHLTFANEHSPPEDVHALDLDGLLAPDILFFSYRVHGELLAIGALKTARRASRRTEVDAHDRSCARPGRRSGDGRPPARGRTRAASHACSLETGTMEAFAPARSLYTRAGFAPCPPFGDYPDSPYSMCMTLSLNSDISSPERRPTWSNSCANTLASSSRERSA